MIIFFDNELFITFVLAEYKEETYSFCICDEPSPIVLSVTDNSGIVIERK